MVGDQRLHCRREIPWAHAVSDSFPIPQSRGTRGPVQSHTLQMLLHFLIHLWRVSSKYPANTESGPKKVLLSKHQERPTNQHAKPYGMKLQFVCVLVPAIDGPAYSGMILCLWITSNKLRNICCEPIWAVWAIVCWMASQLNSLILVLCHDRPLGHIWVQLTNKQPIYHNTFCVWLAVGPIDVTVGAWWGGFDSLLMTNIKTEQRKSEPKARRLGTTRG